MNDYLKTKEFYHSGIKGMRWGVRRYQNEDGSLTEEGKERYCRQLELHWQLHPLLLQFIHNYMDLKILVAKRKVNAKEDNYE